MRRSTAIFLLIACLMIFGSGAQAYLTIRSDNGNELRWNILDMPVGFYIDKDGIPGIPFSSLESSIRASFDTWQNVECSSLTFNYKGIADVGPSDVATADYDNRNVTIWIMENEWPGEWDDAFMLTVPLYEVESGRIIDADILGNKNFLWSVSAEGIAGKADVQNIMTHEVGHFFGLDHPGIPDATMYFSSVEGETHKRTLAADDIQGICHLYPIPGATGSPCETDSDCNTERRCVDHPASGGSICSAYCECDPDCTAPFDCLHGQCLPSLPEVGEMGSSCSSVKPCGDDSLVCVANLCSRYCTSVEDCPQGWQCMELVGGGKACYTSNPQTDGDITSDIELLSFTAQPEGSGSIGDTVVFTSEAKGSENILYRFYIRAPGGDWNIIKDYSKINIAHWTAETIGSFEVRAEVRDQSSEECYDDEGLMYYTIGESDSADGDGSSSDGDSTDGEGFTINSDGGCRQTQLPTAGLIFVVLSLAALLLLRRRNN